jgi:hypothetical protein
MKHTIEIAEPLYQRFKEQADAEEIRVSQLVDHALRTFLEQNGLDSELTEEDDLSEDGNEEEPEDEADESDG